MEPPARCTRIEMTIGWWGVRANGRQREENLVLVFLPQPVLSH